MAAKKKPGRGKKSGTGHVAPYVSERIRELAPEYCWDPRDVEDLIGRIMCEPEPQKKRGQP